MMSSEQTTLLRLDQNMLRNMVGRDRAATTETWPVIHVNEVQRPVGRHQTIPTIDVQAQDLARLPGQRIEMRVIYKRAVGVMRCEGVEYTATAYRVKFPLLTGNMLLHDGMANTALAQTAQLRWAGCGVADKQHIVRLHGMHI